MLNRNDSQGDFLTGVGRGGLTGHQPRAAGVTGTKGRRPFEVGEEVSRHVFGHLCFTFRARFAAGAARFLHAVLHHCCSVFVCAFVFALFFLRGDPSKIKQGSRPPPLGSILALW